MVGFSDRIYRRKTPMIFAAVATLAVMTAILYAPVNTWQMKILMFLLGAFSSGFILAFSLVREINAPWLTGTAIGFINTLNNISGALAQPVVGHLLDKQWNGQLSANGDPLYSHTMYTDCVFVLAGLYIPCLDSIAICPRDFLPGAENLRLFTRYN